MKNHYKTLLLFLTFGLSVIASAQNTAPAIEWQKSIGGTDVEIGYAVKQTSDGGYIMAGSTNSIDGDASGSTGTGNNFWIVKTDESGSITWQTAMDADLIEMASDVIQTSDGGYIAAGYKEMVTSATNSLTDVWVVKLSSTGTVEWEQTYGGSAKEFANKIIEDADSNYVIAGYTISAGGSGDVTAQQGGGDAWILKIDNEGEIIWDKSLGGNNIEEANDIIQTADGGYIMTGFTFSNNGHVSGNHGLFDCWLVKLDTDGNITWQKTLGGSFDDRGTSIKQTPEGGYILAGITSSNDGDVTGFHGTPGLLFNFDFWAIKLDATGNITWSKVFGGTDSDQAYSICPAEDGGYVLAGLSRSNNGDVSGNHGGYDYWVIKIDAGGNLIWQKAMGGTGDDNAYAADNTTDNGFVIFGSAASPNNGDVTGSYYPSSDLWLVKLEGYEIAGTHANAFSNISLYPNPATNNLTINNLQNGAGIKITDVSGKIVYTSKGADTANLDISGLQSGIYMVTMSNGKATETKKLVINR